MCEIRRGTGFLTDGTTCCKTTEEVRKLPPKQVTRTKQCIEKWGRKEKRDYNMNKTGFQGENFNSIFQRNLAKKYF